MSYPETVSYALAVLAAAIIFLLGLLVFYGSIARYFFNSPSGIVFELTGYIMFFSTFLAAPWLLRENKHVSVEILKEFVFHKNTTYLKVASDIICLIVSTAFFIFSALSTYNQYSSGLKTIGLIEMPRYAVSLVIPVCALLMVLILIIRIKNNLQLLKSNRLNDRSIGPPRKTRSS